jgi:hypothetical protein
MQARALWLPSILAIAAAACAGDAKHAYRHVPVATLVGRVRLADGRPLPAYTSIDMARPLLHAGAASDVPAQCAAANAAAQQPVLLGENRMLGGVVVAGSDFTRTPERDPETHVLTISGCRLQPATTAAMLGDRLLLENRDSFPFEPLIGPAYGARALAPGRKVLLPLSAGVDSVRCSTRAPCGRSDLVVFRHPVYAVTDARGNFRIERFPAAELVRVSAWHPLFEESQTFVWLEPGTTSAVELTLEPKTRFEPVLAPQPDVRAAALQPPGGG